MINQNLIAGIETVGDLIEALKSLPKDLPIIYHTERGYAHKGKISITRAKEKLTRIGYNREKQKTYDLHYGDLDGIVITVSEDYSDTEKYPAIELNRPFSLWTHNCGAPGEDFEQGVKLDVDSPESKPEPYIIISKRASSLQSDRYWNGKYWERWSYYPMSEKQ